MDTLVEARQKLDAISTALDSHTISLAAEIEYVAHVVTVGMLELDRTIRDEDDEDAREHAERLRHDILGHLRRVRERAAREAAR